MLTKYFSAINTLKEHQKNIMIVTEWAINSVLVI